MRALVQFEYTVGIAGEVKDGRRERLGVRGSENRRSSLLASRETPAMGVSMNKPSSPPQFLFQSHDRRSI